jgi:hypothetical protein
MIASAVVVTTFCLRAHLFLAPTGSLGTHPTLSSGLYIVRETKTDLVDERHYVIYWPEESTWDDSATSSACRNRVTFMRCADRDCLASIFLSYRVDISRRCVTKSLRCYPPNNRHP